MLLLPVLAVSVRGLPYTLYVVNLNVDVTRTTAAVFSLQPSDSRVSFEFSVSAIYEVTAVHLGGTRYNDVAYPWVGYVYLNGELVLVQTEEGEVLYRKRGALTAPGWCNVKVVLEFTGEVPEIYYVSVSFTERVTASIAFTSTGLAKIFLYPSLPPVYIYQAENTQVALVEVLAYYPGLDPSEMEFAIESVTTQLTQIWGSRTMLDYRPEEEYLFMEFTNNAGQRFYFTATPYHMSLSVLGDFGWNSPSLSLWQVLPTACSPEHIPSLPGFPFMLYYQVRESGVLEGQLTPDDVTFVWDDQLGQTYASTLTGLRLSQLPVMPIYLHPVGTVSQRVKPAVEAFMERELEYWEEWGWNVSYEVEVVGAVPVTQYGSNWVVPIPYGEVGGYGAYIYVAAKVKMLLPENLTEYYTLLFRVPTYFTLLRLLPSIAPPEGFPYDYAFIEVWGSVMRFVVVADNFAYYYVFARVLPNLTVVTDYPHVTSISGLDYIVAVQVPMTRLNVGNATAYFMNTGAYAQDDSIVVERSALLIIASPAPFTLAAPVTPYYATKTVGGQTQYLAVVNAIPGVYTIIPQAPAQQPPGEQPPGEQPPSQPPPSQPPPGGQPPSQPPPSEQPPEEQPEEAPGEEPPEEERPGGLVERVVGSLLRYWWVLLLLGGVGALSYYAYRRRGGGIALG